MIRTLLPFALGAVLFAVAAAPRGPVTREALQAHLRFLSDDLLEGRAIGTRGDALAQAYLESVFRAAGLRPAFGTSYRQGLTLRHVTPDADATLEFGVKPPQVARFGTDYVAHFPFAAPAQHVEADLVYAGYGITAPAWSWDDFKGVDVRGKVLLVHVNEPGRDDPALFEGPALTYFGRWTYKFEEAQRRGAAGVLLIHDDADAGYGWEVVRNGAETGADFDAGRADLLPFQGWISGGTARRLLLAAGLDPAALRASAETRGFRPVPLGVRVRTTAHPRYATVATANVAGIVPGRTRERTIVLSAHHDHLGTGTLDGRAAIYNGAVDNASALAVLLALAQRHGAHPGTLDADLLFLAPAAEEAGLLGSARFALDPPVPLARVAANVNFEMTTVWGPARDLTAIGARHSDLDRIIGGVAAAHGLRVSPEGAPEQGYFFRSDQFSFAKAGVPSAWLDLGDDLVDGGVAAGRALRDRYRRTMYHQPADRFDPAWPLTGTAQLAAVADDLVRAIDREGRVLAWKKGAPFSR